MVPVNFQHFPQECLGRIRCRLCFQRSVGQGAFARIKVSGQVEERARVPRKQVDRNLQQKLYAGKVIGVTKKPCQIKMRFTVKGIEVDQPFQEKLKFLNVLARLGDFGCQLEIGRLVGLELDG